MSAIAARAAVDATADDKTLVECLTALANLNRLILLRGLREPRALREIEVPAEGHGTPIARQSVRRHLDALLATGIIVARETERDYGETTEFVVNHQRIFAIAEEMRGLARIRPAVEHDAPTEGASGAVGARGTGPMLVLVRGLDEGTTYPLAPATEGQAWTLGRRRGVAISLDFDPSVSAEHASLTWTGGRPVLRDLGSRNGVSHNLRRVPATSAVPLQHGDLLGLGRSLLLYWS